VGERKTESPRSAQADPVEFARNVALNSLSSRAKSRRELELQLERRGVEVDCAKLVLDRLMAVGLVNDLEFARAWSRSRQSSKGISRRLLARELNAKGIDRDIAENVLAEISPEDEYEAARTIAEKKARSIAQLPREIQVRRVFDLLTRRGFPPAVSASIVREVLPN